MFHPRIYCSRGSRYSIFGKMTLMRIMTVYLQLFEQEQKYMQKQTVNKTTLIHANKKKKNKAWNSSPIEPEPANTNNHPSAQELSNYISPIDLVKKQSKSQQNLSGMKKLSEMAQLYHIQMGLELGAGFASNVYFGQNILTQQPVCIKVVDLLALGGDKERQSLQREIRYLRECDSKHIVQLLDAYESPTFYYLVMEFCAGGDLYRFLKKSHPFHPLFARQFIQQISEGLLTLKEKRLIHRDIKTENILLGQNFEAKLGDLGFCVNEEENNIIHNVGSPIYMSPEVLQGRPHSFASDVYGLGIIWYELLHWHAPWQALNEMELITKKITSPLIFGREDISMSDRQIIGRCLEVDPEKRCKIEEIMAYCKDNNKSEMELLTHQPFPQPTPQQPQSKQSQEQ